MTTGQKAAETRQQHREAQKAREAQARADKEKALEVCRLIRDDPAAAHADRLEAIRLLQILS